MDPTTIFFAVLAGFICYQLYTVLGRKGGHEPEENDQPLPPPTIDASAEAVEATVEAERDDLPDWIRQVREIYPLFSEKDFVDGARAAYEMIVEAFAGNSLSSVKPYIAPSVYKAFETAVASREAARQTSEVQFVGTENADVSDTKIDGGFVQITVTFISNQIRVLRDDRGEVVEGDPNRIDRVKDRWTFSRSANSNDPNWQLVATGGQEPAAG